MLPAQQNAASRMRPLPYQHVAIIPVQRLRIEDRGKPGEATNDSEPPAARDGFQETCAAPIATQIGVVSPSAITHARRHELQPGAISAENATRCRMEVQNTTGRSPRRGMMKSPCSHSNGASAQPRSSSAARSPTAG